MSRSPRRRLRASDVGRTGPSPWVSLALLLIALVVVLVFRSVIGDRTSSFVEGLTADPGLELPPSALERDEIEPDSRAPDPRRDPDAASGL